MYIRLYMYTYKALICTNIHVRTLSQAHMHTIMHDELFVKVFAKGTNKIEKVLLYMHHFSCSSDSRWHFHLRPSLKLEARLFFCVGDPQKVPRIIHTILDCCDLITWRNNVQSTQNVNRLIFWSEVRRELLIPSAILLLNKSQWTHHQLTFSTIICWWFILGYEQISKKLISNYLWVGIDDLFTASNDHPVVLLFQRNYFYINTLIKLF